MTHFPDEMHLLHLLEATQSILSKSATTKHDHACSLHTCSSKLVMNTIIIPAKILAKKQLWSEFNSFVSTVACPDRLKYFGIAMNMQLFIMVGHKYTFCRTTFSGTLILSRAGQKRPTWLG